MLLVSQKINFSLKIIFRNLCFRFDQLVRAAGRSLSHKVYCMITYVEENQKPEKVIRETKFLPKLVLRIETFNKYVIYFGKKTKFDLSNYIHIGRVRYFRIKHLQDVLDQTMESAGNALDVDESNLDEQEQDNDNELSDSESNLPDDSSTPVSSITTSSGLTKDGDSDVGMTKAKILRNMDRINKNAKRVQKPSAKEKEAPPSKRRKTKSKNI